MNRLPLIFLLLISSCTRPAFGDVIEKVIYCIMGEARGEGASGMLAVAEAIRNRGTLDGVYGCDATFKIKRNIVKDARTLWKYSKNTNFVKGATHWESTDFEAPYWAKDMVRTVTIGKHVFYKEVR